jgi:uncharacterized membrane protein
MILLQDDLSWLMDLGIIAVIVGLILLAIWIWAIVDILKRPMSGLMKIIWIALVFFLPFIGVILYLIFGRTTTSNTTGTRRY